MNFIVRNIDGFRVAWPSRRSGWKINVDDRPTLTVWSHNAYGKKLLVHFQKPEDEVPVDTIRNLVFMLKGPEPASVLTARATKPAIERCIDEHGKRVPLYYEQEYELVGRLRK